MTDILKNIFSGGGMISFRLHILSILISLAMLAFIFHSIKKGKLHIRHSILWLLVGVACLAISIIPKIFFYITGLFGIGMPISALFFLSIIFLMVTVFNLTLNLSKLSEENKKLTQAVSILNHEIEETRKANGKEDIRKTDKINK